MNTLLWVFILVANAIAVVFVLNLKLNDAYFKRHGLLQDPEADQRRAEAKHAVRH
jgi:hypothetical protein